MTTGELVQEIRMQFGHVPTREQEVAVECFVRFLADRSDRVAMILRGAAGTGKTSLAGAMVQTLRRLGVKTVLLAPTGRAAKVFALNSSQQALTIHRKIYRQKSMESGFGLGFNAHADTLFLVDEASMIANGGMAESVFGSGRLLDDLITFVYGGRNCRLMFIGDHAQLPPVGEETSPALDSAVVGGYGLKVYEATLNEVLRQSRESGILWNATRVRGDSSLVSIDSIASIASIESMASTEIPLPKIRFWGFADICRVPGDELIESLASSYSRVGLDETMVVTRSNKRAIVYNMGIRNTILDREEELTTGDQLMVVKNKYLSNPNNPNHPSNQNNPITPPSPPFDFIANGDRVVVRRVRNVHEAYGFRFAQVLLQFPDYDDYEMQSMVLLDTLTTEAPALTREQQNQLYVNVWEDYADIRSKSERMKRLKEDEHYTALQVKFGYAVTCHKAQGGQWAHVYVDQGYMTDEMLTPDYVHWLYTAFTRATEKLFLVNWPKRQTDEEELENAE